ncbi:MAG: TRAP transporter substrate-binding protein [Deltaproteobacteria bacterium]|nr:TRAP transporter substrate-binding protein [Deltaproteobacteria bacterium]MBW2017316.1 TRAP transporter substrate-binding protein [Deltaproteobacteria bacterium]MBW2128787.1 TRAP transporter substrate-binding protein [Deltaproteobacteria bacterium]MBW2303788.1 TRAP transporter substrate-binding protein [Deltaproteobacteria bacterium]
MKKVILVGMALVFACVLFSGIMATPAAAKTIELKLAHFVPTMHVQHRKAFKPFADEVKRLTNGKVVIKIYPGATLANPKTMVDAITTGITDIGFVLPEYIPGRFKRSSVLELPFIFNNAVHVTKTVYDIYDSYLAEDYKQFKVLWFLSAPLSQLHTVRKAVTKMDDFKGMKIRSASATETAGLKLLGANPIGMPISELSISLQKGVVDGAVTPYAALLSHKLIDVIKHITEINYNGALMCILMNKRKWNSLPDFAKKAIDQVANRDFGIKAAAAFDEEDAENIEAGKAKGIQFHKLPEAEKAKMREALKGIWDNWVREKSKKGIPAKEILEATLAAAKANQ